MLSGLHLPNAPIGGVDYEVARWGQFRAFKILASDHCAADADALRRAFPGCRLIGRLGNSQRPDGTYRDAGEYGRTEGAKARAFGDMVAVWIMDNEPNWQWTKAAYGPMQYRFWARAALASLRAACPGIVVSAPPLSYSSALWHHDSANPTAWILDEWHAAYQWTDGGKETSLWSWFEYATAHCYWQHAEDGRDQLHDPSYGGVFVQTHDRSGNKPVIVGEWGSSQNELEPPPSPEALEALRCEQYPHWLAWAGSYDYVDSAFVFISPGSTPDWAGFRVTPAVAQAMASQGKRRRSLTGPWAV